MKILIVGSLNTHAGKFAPFITEQAEALRLAGCEIDYFGIVGKGLKGYLRALKALKLKIRDFQPDVVHAHYGLSGLLANLATRTPYTIHRTPILTTYHGSDINNPKVLPLSRLAMRLSAWNIFVSQRTMHIALDRQPASLARKSSLIPCGINMPLPAEQLPDMSSVLEPNKKHVLFAGAFSNQVKDPQLAQRTVEELSLNSEEPVQLIELKGYTRDEVSALMYACDAFLMTSKTEGSPQVIKEALACCCPIVSVDVGDVRERLTVSMEGELLAGCYVTESRDPMDLAFLLKKALDFGQRTEGHQQIVNMCLSNDQIAQKLIDIYQSLLKNYTKVPGTLV